MGSIMADTEAMTRDGTVFVARQTLGIVFGRSQQLFSRRPVRSMAGQTSRLTFIFNVEGGGMARTITKGLMGLFAMAGNTEG